MPRPAVTESCSDPENVLVTFSLCNALFETPENTQCFPDGIHTPVGLQCLRQYRALDPASTDFQCPGHRCCFIALTITGSGPNTKLVNASQSTVSASGLNVGEIVGSFPPQVQPLKATPSLIAPRQSATFTLFKKRVITAQST